MKVEDGLFTPLINRRDRILIWYLFESNFVIKEKGISLHKVIKYVKKIKSSYNDFGAEPLTFLYVTLREN